MTRNMTPRKQHRSARPEPARPLTPGSMDAMDLLRIQRDLGIALSRISTIRPALQRVLAAATSVEGIDAGGVYLVDHGARTVELVAHRGLSRRFIAIVSRYDVTAPLARRVMQGRPVYRDHKQIQANPLFLNEGFLSVAGFPIRYSRNVIAVMNLASRSCPTIPRFTRTVLGAIAEQIGTVVPRIRAETEWREAQANLRSLFDKAGDLLFILDPKGNIVDTNQAVLSLLGYSRRQLIGRPIGNVQPRSVPNGSPTNGTGSLGEVQTGCQGFLETRSGARIPVETRITPGRWDGKQALFAVSSDIRERIRTEREVVRIGESEKMRIAQDIHDSLMQQLAGIVLLAGSLKRQLATAGTAARDATERILKESRDALTTSRRMIQGLAPIDPIEGGMEVALHRLAQDFGQTHGCDCRIQCLLGTDALDAVAATQLYYIVQECVRNACSHGAATRVDVILSARANSGVLTVTDNGSGMKSRAKAGRGMGLRIMAHRADMIGGQLSVTSSSQNGTTVRCAFSFSPVEPRGSATNPKTARRGKSSP